MVCRISMCFNNGHIQVANSKKVSGPSLPNSKIIMRLNTQNNTKRSGSVLAMNLAEINKTKGCGCGGGK